MKLITILAAVLVLSSSWHAEAFDTANGTLCPVNTHGTDGNPNYWVGCADSCSDARTVIGGECYALDTRGHGMALDSLGITKEGWYCRWVDARLVGTGQTLNKDMQLYSIARCSGN